MSRDFVCQAACLLSFKVIVIQIILCIVPLSNVYIDVYDVVRNIHK